MNQFRTLCTINTIEILKNEFETDLYSEFKERLKDGYFHLFIFRQYARKVLESLRQKNCKKQT